MTDKTDFTMKPRKKWLRTAARLVVIVSAVTLLSGGYTYWRYPGLIGNALVDIRTTPWTELIQIYRFSNYYFQYIGNMRLNSKTQMYDFQSIIKQEQHRDPSWEQGVLLYHDGQFEQAIQEITWDIDQRGETENKLFWLGLAYQRLAEQQNCAAHCLAGDSSAYCSLPLQSLHQSPEPSRQAAAIFMKLLDQYDESNRLYLWLLNFSHMTLGQFPQQGPPRHRLTGQFVDTFYGATADEMSRRYSHLAFRERAAELKINTLDAGKGVAVEDFDRDGDLDLITGGTFTSLKYYRNEKGNTFVEASQAAGLADVSQTHTLTAADFDNDGWMDLFVSHPFGHFQLFRNVDGQRFEDVTSAVGLLGGPDQKSQAVITFGSAWGDINNDGYLDLFLAQFGQRVPFGKGVLSREPMESKLYLNTALEGEPSRRKFTDVTVKYGLNATVADQVFLGAAFGDYDRDGFVDLFLSTFMKNRSVLLRNIRGRRFERTELIRPRQHGFTAAFLDVNQDGWLDLFQGGSCPAEVVVSHVLNNVKNSPYGSTIYIQKDGRFEKRSDLFRNGLPIGTMGASFGDINNDGAVDFYLGTGSPEGSFVMPNLMYIGEVVGTRCTGFMDNVSMLHGWGTVQKGHGIVFFDFDGDGDQDIYSSLGGMWPGDAWPNQFFVNESPPTNNWIKLRLRGRQTNFYGIGAHIRVVAENADGQAIVRHYDMNNKTGFGSAPYLAHIGLLDARRVLSVHVDWPVSRATKVYQAQLNRLNILDEGAPSGME